MAYENSAGLNVYNQYGPRPTGGSVGVETDKNSIHSLSLNFTGKSINEVFLPPFVIPRGAHFLRYVLRVDEAFALTGTAPTIIFGGTAPATNGIVLSEAELEAIGTKVPASTGTGTWAVASATGTTAAERVTRAIGGTGGPAVDPTIGKAVLICEYVFTTLV